MKQQITGKLIYAEAENQHFRPTGRCAAPIHVKVGIVQWHMGPLGRTKSNASRCTGVDTRPPKFEKFVVFW